MAYYQPAQAYMPNGALNHRWHDPAPQSQQAPYPHPHQHHQHQQNQQYVQKGQSEWPAVIENNELVWQSHASQQDACENQYEYASAPVPGGVPGYADADATTHYQHARHTQSHQQPQQQDPYHPHEYVQQPQQGYTQPQCQAHNDGYTHAHGHPQPQAPPPQALPCHPYNAHYQQHQHDGYASHQQHPPVQREDRKSDIVNEAYRAYIARSADAILAGGAHGLESDGPSPPPSSSSSLIGDGSSCSSYTRLIPSRGGSTSSLSSVGRGSSPMKMEGDERRFPTLLSSAPLGPQSQIVQPHQQQQQYQEQHCHRGQPKQEYAEQEQGYDDEDGEYELEYPEHHYASQVQPQQHPPQAHHPSHHQQRFPSAEMAQRELDMANQRERERKQRECDQPQPKQEVKEESEELPVPTRIVPSQAHLPPSQAHVLPHLPPHPHHRQQGQYQPFYQDHHQQRRLVDPDAPFVSPLTAGIPPLASASQLQHHPQQSQKAPALGSPIKLGAHASVDSGLGSIVIGAATREREVTREGSLTGMDVGARVAAVGALRPEKKQALACLFCRERKIACGRPEAGSEDPTCNQCARRHISCEYPKESRRGQHKRTRKRKLGDDRGEGHNVNEGRLMASNIDLRDHDEAEQ